MDRTYTTFKKQNKNHNVRSFTWVSRFTTIWYRPLSKPVKLTNSYTHSYYSLYSASQTMSSKCYLSLSRHLSPYSAHPLQYYPLHYPSPSACQPSALPVIDFLIINETINISCHIYSNTHVHTLHFSE